MIDALCMAFLIYSIIPVPQREWKPGRMSGVLAAFPAVGLVTASISFLARWLAVEAGLGIAVRAAVFTAAPIILTGAIHLDGFMDTVDAAASRADREKKLQILKDPHIGAFAAAGCAIYLMLYAAFAAELDTRGALAMIPASVLSRAISSWAAVTLPSARKGGMLDSLRDDSEGTKKSGTRAARIVQTASLGWAAAAVTAMLLIAGISGAAAALAALIVMLYYIFFAKRQFGGVTGDLAGFFLQLCELVVLMTVAVVGRIT